MTIQLYYVMHIVGAILLVGMAFRAFAAPLPENKRSTMILSGIFALLALVGGFGLIARYELPYTAIWILLKFAAWLGIAVLSGLAFRMQKLATLGTIAVGLLAGLAVYSVYYRPV